MGASDTRVVAIVPALNEAGSIGGLVRSLRAQPVDEVVVVDNGSSDATGPAAEAAGARVVRESRRGYGYACRCGLRAADGAGVLVFVDGDGSFLPEEVPALLEPVLAGRADLVLGSRMLGRIEPGSMPVHQRLGNRLISGLVSGIHRVPLTDLGPFRAVRADLLASLDMREMTFGWPVEMILKAAGRGARIVEVPVTYRARVAGRSKVSGSLRGAVLAAYHLTGVTLRHPRRGRAW